MTLEQDLYDKFVETLINKLKTGAEVSPKDLDVIQKFIAQQGLKACYKKHDKLKDLVDGDKFEIPEFDESPIKRVK